MPVIKPTWSRSALIVIAIASSAFAGALGHMIGNTSGAVIWCNLNRRSSLCLQAQAATALGREREAYAEIVGREGAVCNWRPPLRLLRSPLSRPLSSKQEKAGRLSAGLAK